MAQKKHKKKKKVQSGLKQFVLVLAGLLITILVLFSVLKLPPNNKKIVSKKTPAKTYKKHQYEEVIITPFEQKIKLVDLLLFNSLLKAKIKPSEFHINEMNEKAFKGVLFFEHQIEIRTDKKKIKYFLELLQKNSKEFKQEHIEIKYALQQINILIDGILTHKIWIYPKILHETKVKKGKIILIIDDIGRDLKIANELIEQFNSDINLSILPYSPYAKKIEKLCVKKNIPILLHMPMEPMSYPDADPGKGALFTRYNPNEIKKLTNSAIDSLPNIIGVNNHMGSKFTANLDGMTIFLKELKKRNLIFIDSLTTPKSVTKIVANQLGIKVFSRDVFIDNSKNVQEILLQLRKAEVYSLKKDFVIVIGHPYPETVKALKVWFKIKDPNVKLVSALYLKRFLN